LRFILFTCFLIFLLVGTVLPGGAVVEKKVPEASKNTIMPYFAKHFQKSFMKTHDGVEIRYAASEAADGRPALVIVDGRTEFIAKYAEILYDLKDLGFSFYIYDHRGQGESSRMLADPQKGYVKHFEDYVEDLHLFLKTVVKGNEHRSVFLLSHSMGGPVSILLERKYPGEINGMILCSPMLSVNTAPFPKFVAKVLSKAFVLVGMGKRYVIGGGPYKHDLPFENNDLTDSYARFELNRRLVEDNPKVALGSPTFRWLSEAFSAMDAITSGVSPLKVPMLLLVGEDDTVVGTKAQKAFCESQKNCSLVVLPKGKHELLMEKDQVRDGVLEHIKLFLNTYATNSSEKTAARPSLSKDSQ